MLSFVNISKSFGHKKLFENLTHSIPEGKHVALIGANGAGKTSLLNILCGLDTCDGNGSVVKPKGSFLSYLPQEPNPFPQKTVIEECLHGNLLLWELFHKKNELLEKMGTEYSEELYELYEKAEQAFTQNNGYQIEGKAQRLLKGLHFTENDFEKDPKSLSGGWRMRLELARILLNDPDILMLDEPTNHLDLPSLLFLENYLSGFKGTLLLVSHDQEILDRLAERILYLNNGKITEYAGNFSRFLELRALEKEQIASQKQQLDKKIEHAQDFVNRFGAKASKAKQASSRKKMISRLESIQNSLESDDLKIFPQIYFTMLKQSAKNALHFENLVVGYKKPLIKPLNLRIERGEKIAIIGANGLGKSTILKTLAGVNPPMGGTFTWGEHIMVGYYAQSQLDQLDLTKTAFDNVLSANQMLADQEIRKILGSMMFKDIDAYKNVGVMSGGEKSRVGLACLMAKKNNVLLLDEPTNHLDMIAMEKLADGLEAFEGTILFVSHDRRFINRVATRVLGINDKGAHLLSYGQFDDFLSEAQRLHFEWN